MPERIHILFAAVSLVSMSCALADEAGIPRLADQASMSYGEKRTIEKLRDYRACAQTVQDNNLQRTLAIQAKARKIVADIPRESVEEKTRQKAAQEGLTDQQIKMAFDTFRDSELQILEGILETTTSPADQSCYKRFNNGLDKDRAALEEKYGRVTIVQQIYSDAKPTGLALVHD